MGAAALALDLREDGLSPEPEPKGCELESSSPGADGFCFSPGAEVGRGVPVPKAPAPLPLLACSDPFPATEDGGGGGRRQDRRRSPPCISPAAGQVRW